MNPIQDFERAIRWLGYHTQFVHCLHVMFDMFSLIHTQGAGEMLDVNHVRLAELGKAQHGERSASEKVAAGAPRDYLERDVWLCREFDEVADLGAHDLPAADLPAERGFVDYCPQPWGAGTTEQLVLPGQAEVDPLLDVLRARPGPPRPVSSQ